MLVIARKIGESFMVGDAKITLLKKKGNNYRIGIEAPKEINITRLKGTLDNEIQNRS